MGRNFVGTPIIWGLGAFLVIAGPILFASPAQAVSAGCTAANNNGLTQSIPRNTTTIRTQMAAFDAGDRLTVNVTGNPVSAAVDLGAGLVLVNLANTNGSGSVVIPPTLSTFTITSSGTANPTADLFFHFSCTPATNTLTTPLTAPPDPEDEADAATNTTTTYITVENAIVDEILQNAGNTDPEFGDPDAKDPISGSTFSYSPEHEAEILKLREDVRTYNAAMTKIAKRLAEIDGILDAHRQRNQAIRDAQQPASTELTGDDRFGRDLARALVPVDITDDLSEINENPQPVGNTIPIPQEILDEQSSLLGEQNDLREKLSAAFDRERQIDIETGIDPDAPPEFRFAGRDPFARALLRYRGFRLDVADTGEGFNDSVKPLSFTRTLSSTIVGWVRAIYTDYEQDDASRQEGDNILVALGAHKDFNDDLRIGLFATTTWGDVTSTVNNLDIDTTGYSLGAYGRYKWGEIDVNASTRIGLTDNDISVSGTTGSYDTRLASLTFGISGQEQMSDDVWMRPAISITNTWVNREDYVNSAGTAIGGNTTWTGNVSAGPTIGTSLTPPSGFKRLEPAIGLQATYNYSDQDTQSGTVATSETDYLSLSVSPQLSMEFDNGASVDVFGSYFGIGADLDGWSVGGTLSIPLN